MALKKFDVLIICVLAAFGLCLTMSVECKSDALGDDDFKITCDKEATEPKVEDAKKAVQHIRELNKDYCCMLNETDSDGWGCQTLYTYGKADVRMCAKFQVCVNCQLAAGEAVNRILADCATVPSGSNDEFVSGVAEYEAGLNDEVKNYSIVASSCPRDSEAYIKQMVA